VKQGTDVESSKASPITVQVEWEGIVKGTPQWQERQDFFWKCEIERMFVPWPVRIGQERDLMEALREWMLKSLESPFLRYPRKEESYSSILEVPNNQEAIQEMLVKNPLFEEKKWPEKCLDWSHPERVEERNRREAEGRRILEERWQ
jgi:hypothetical protein